MVYVQEYGIMQYRVYHKLVGGVYLDIWSTIHFCGYYTVVVE